MKKVFITGGSRGIGKAAVRLFLKNGWEVGFSYCHSKDAAESLVREGQGCCDSFQCDFGSDHASSDLAERILNDFGVPDVLVNNAGISSYGLFQDLTEEQVNRLFRINFESMYSLSARISPRMIARGSGRIVNVSSMWGERGASCEVAYSASKSAVIGFTRALAKELAPSRIPVNAVSPGVVETDMMDRFSEEEKKEICESIPMGRFALADEVAELILYLASDAPDYLTGQIIGINGGYF